MVFLQNYTNIEKDVPGPHVETYPTSDDANHAKNIKAEEVSDTEHIEDPVPMPFLKIKGEAEVSYMSVCVHC
jgi:hypothetical protein